MTLYKGTTPIAGLSTNKIVTGFNILDCKWSDHVINDIQWLRADTFSWQDGNVYTTVYNKLVEEYATGTEETEGSITFKRTTNGFKIATADYEEDILNKYNTDGIAWYYILDTTNKRFKLPRTKFGFEGLRGNVGDDIAESLPNIKGNTGMNWGGSWGPTGAFGNTGGTDEKFGGTFGTTARVDFNASRSSSTYKDNAPVQERATQMYLYFYVGEYAQSAVEQTAGLNAELFNGKADISALTPLKNRYVVAKSDKSLMPSWWVEYSDGWCEQGGLLSAEATLISLTKAYSNTNYNVSITIYNESTPGSVRAVKPSGMTTSSFKITDSIRVYWQTSGYIN